MTASLSRRATAEFAGTAGLVTVVVGSGIAAETYSSDPGLQLLENALATTAGLAVLILVFGPVSGAHFNPVVTAAEWFRARRTKTGISLQESAGYVAAQLAGAIGGCVLANLMYDDAAVSWSTRNREGAHLLLAEVVATAGLLLVILAVGRAGRPARTAWSVGAYIGAAYWFTSSTSFANPAVTVGRAFTDSFAGIAPADVPGFVIAQFAGAAVGVALFTGVYRDNSGADDLVVPHDDDPRQGVRAARNA